MRIISGRFKGKKLAESSGNKGDLRPTTDMNRENLFNILSSSVILKEKGFDLEDCVMLDLCCGTGSVGFESLSRGAKKCVFIDIDKKHLKLVEKNSKLMSLQDEVEILNFDATKLPKFLGKNYKFDFIFIDPPYKNDYFKIFKSLNDLDMFTENSLVVVECEKKMDLDCCEGEGLELLFKKEYGKSCFGFFWYQAPLKAPGVVKLV